MKRRPSSSCFSRTAGSFSCIRDEAPRSLITIPSAARSFFVSARRVPESSGHLRQVHLARDAAQLDPGVAERSALSRIVFQLQGGQPSVENAIG